MRWIRQSASAALLTAQAARSRAESFTDLNVVRYAVTVSGKDSRGVFWSLSQPGAVYSRLAEYLKLAAEPCSLLLLGTGVIGFSLLLMRERLRIQPDALIETQCSAVASPEATARI